MHTVFCHPAHGVLVCHQINDGLPLKGIEFVTILIPVGRDSERILPSAGKFISERVGIVL